MAQHRLGHHGVAHTILADVQLPRQSTLTREGYQQTASFIKNAAALVDSTTQSSGNLSDPFHSEPPSVTDSHPADPNQLRGHRER